VLGFFLCSVSAFQQIYGLICNIVSFIKPVSSTEQAIYISFESVKTVRSITNKMKKNIWRNKPAFINVLEEYRDNPKN